jgi:hypothetical protein
VPAAAQLRREPTVGPTGHLPRLCQ